MARSKDTNIPRTWTDAETLAESQLWAVKAGCIAIAFGGGTPDNEDGIPFYTGDVLRLEAGETVQYRRLSHDAAHLQREPKA